MILEKFLLKDGVSIEEKFKALNSEDHATLLSEINQKREQLKEEKIVNETQLKTLQEQESMLLNNLKEKYNINSIKEAETKIAELSDEIISALTNFAEECSTE